MVEGVEQISMHLKANLFGKLEILSKLRIQVPHARVKIAVTLGGAGTRRSSGYPDDGDFGERSGIQIIMRATVVVQVRAYSWNRIRTVRGISAARVPDGEGESRLSNQDT